MRFRTIRDIQRSDPDLFRTIFEIQDHSYRQNRSIRDRVWTYETFLERSAGYVVLGRLPVRNANGHYPTAEEAHRQRVGFLFGRLLPEGAAHPWLKLSGLAGHREGILHATSEALASGLPIVAAVDPRFDRIARRVGFRSLPVVAARWLVPILAAAFVLPPWQFHGVSRTGAIRVTHPELREPATGAPVVFEKSILVSPDALRWLLTPSGILTTARLIGRRAAGAAP